MLKSKDLIVANLIYLPEAKAFGANLVQSSTKTISLDDNQHCQWSGDIGVYRPYVLSMIDGGFEPILTNAAERTKGSNVLR